MSSKTVLGIVLLACVGASLVGCASHSARVIARCAAQPLPANAMKIGLMKQAQPRPRDQAVEHVVVAELERIGHHLVLQPEADYTLACFVEDNAVAFQRDAPPLPTASFQRPISLSGGGIYQEPWRQSLPALPGYPRERVTELVPTQGIRFRLFANSSLRAGRFEPVWDGYVDAGLELRPEKQLPLVRALLLHFGRDFTGKVKLAPGP